MQTVTISRGANEHIAEQSLRADCSLLTAYFAEFDAIFFTMASTSLRSLSFKLVE